MNNASKFHSNDYKIIWNQANKLDFASQFVQQSVYHTTDSIMAQNSPALAQTAPRWTTNTEIYKIRAFLGFFFHKWKRFHRHLFWFEFWWRECLFQALHCFTRLQETIAILLSVYMHWILTFGDCFTDSSLIQCRWLSQMADNLQF